jgi:DNA repair protein RadC
MTNLIISKSESFPGSLGACENQAGPAMHQHDGQTDGRAELSFVREVSVKYRGPRRARSPIRMAADAADFIRNVLPDNAREHFVYIRALNKGHMTSQKPSKTGHFMTIHVPLLMRRYIALFLDGSHQVVAFSITATGTANHCLVHAREVFQPAILVGAVAVAVGHNHPSGECFPSGQDDEVTGNLKEAGRLLGIKLLDHIIVCDDAFYSYSERGSL